MQDIGDTREPLSCEECEATADVDVEAHGWRAFIVLLEEDQPAELAIYCPACAAREFGDDQRRLYANG